MDLEPSRADCHNTTCAPSTSTNLGALDVQTGPSPSTDSPGAPLSNKPTPPMVMGTSANFSPTQCSSQLTATTAHAPPGSTVSATTTSLGRSVPPQSAPENLAPVQTPAPLNVSLPSTSPANTARDATVRTTPPTCTTAGAEKSINIESDGAARPSPTSASLPPCFVVAQKWIDMESDDEAERPSSASAGLTPNLAVAHPTSAPRTNSASTVPSVYQNSDSQSRIPGTLVCLPPLLIGLCG